MTFNDMYISARSDLQRKEKLILKRDEVLKELQTANDELVDTLGAQRLLSIVSEENTVKTLDYITSVLNKVLSDIFKGSVRRVYLEKKLHNNRYAHIVVKLENGSGVQRNLKLQTGSGIKEVLSFLFTACFIMVRDGRKLMIFDEVLSGLHPEATEVVMDLMGIFAKQGMQFMFVGYAMDNHNGETFGKIYNVQNPDGTTAALHLVEGTYNGERFVS